MASTVNIFKTLPQSPQDSDDEGSRPTQNKKGDTRKDAPRGNTASNKDSKTQGQKQQQNPQKTQGDQKNRGPQGDLGHKDQKGQQAGHKEHQKKKTDLEHPHELERHSGTGQQAYGGKPKKGGAGKGNWGNDKKENDNEGEEATNEENKEGKEEAPTGISLSEYYSQTKYSSNQPQVNEAKAKITSEQLMKEVGTATLLKTKIQQNIDDHKAGKKKDFIDTEHKAAISTEHAGLLNFRTGFIEKEYKKKERDENAPRKFAPRTDKDNKEEGEAKVEGEVKTEAVEGEQQGHKEGHREGHDDNRRRYGGNRREDGGNYRGRGNYRGDRGDRHHGERRYGDKNQGERHYLEKKEGEQTQGEKPQGEKQHTEKKEGDRPHKPHGDRPHGDKPHGDKPHGDRPHGGKKHYGGNQTAQINFDESAFPKLG